MTVRSHITEWLSDPAGVNLSLFNPKTFNTYPVSFPCGLLFDISVNSKRVMKFGKFMCLCFRSWILESDQLVEFVTISDSV